MSTPTQIPVWSIDTGPAAAQAVAHAVQNRQIGQGKLTRLFEQQLAQLLGVPHLFCTTSGTNALLMALIQLGVGCGDEVIIPAMSWVATANAPLLLGAKVVLVDVEPTRPVMDINKLQAAISPKTKAIIAVHLNGIATQMEPLLAIAQAHGIGVVEDACQALLSRHHGRCLGSFGRFGAFSLGVAKMLTTGQGGLLVCQSAEDAAAIESIRNQGQCGGVLGEKMERLGGNFKFNDVLAALGLVQLPLLAGRVRHHLAIQEAYARGLAGVAGMRAISANAAAGEHPLRAEWHCQDRQRFIQRMAEQGIEVAARSTGLHRVPHIGAQLADCEQYPHAQAYEGHFITLPSGPEQPLENVQRVIEAIHAL
ncbi:DegT/DnrJ/EryC1/StrS aminotransferase [Magnetococcus marinus MC-1]|uniref:DegT/DnrJ/EryC1/StrS aminotransferase n=1 Tax=Magnetococcus marinus (strain ATCC BAA-1437 / JCM 17883 / MC-1) TaxID=156889 RepID=A0L5I7_MAGMM|nr:DegT/DnrJ/EryC1/StrS family aminotransferase [Magnetococcus marinus]ABK43230.1 DegT/DnrJ/EryC1/StrS aminotransferase [Magnetococcus marinus MC-1]